jgi:hypothetical protein
MSSPAWTLGSWVRIPLEAWMFVCVYSVFVLSCVGSGLAMGWSLVQGVLPTVFKCKIAEPHKEEAKARYGLQRHIRRRREEGDFKVTELSSLKLKILTFSVLILQTSALVCNKAALLICLGLPFNGMWRCDGMRVWGGSVKAPNT